MQLRLSILLLSLITYQAIFVHSQVTQDIVDTAIAAGNFQTLVRLLNAADLATALKAPGPFTVFAPNDDAFNKLPPGTVDDLVKPENKEKLANILKYHVLNGNITAAQVLGFNLPEYSPETLLKKFLILDKDANNKVKVNDATVTTADTFATNGIIHTIDTVLLPPNDIVDTAVANPNFKTLVAALTAADLAGALKGTGPFTVFAPTDAAFSKLPAGVVDALLKAENKASLAKILSYHVTSQIITSSSIGRLALPVNITMLAGGSARVSKDGTTVKINDASITAVDTFNSNGMIHVIDTVILPPLDIVETAITNGNFKTLVTALGAADLVAALKAPGPLTVFAPTDTAFNKLAAGVVGELVKAENKPTLQKILKYHVYGNRLSSADIVAMTLPANLSMLSGDNAVLSKNGPTIKIDSAEITQADVSNTNGYIHVLDNVILPPLDIVETALTNGNFKTLLTALAAADLTSTLKGNGPFTVLAPTDAAFNKLPPGTVDDLLKPENKGKLANILKYHVIDGRVSSADILGMNLPAQVNTKANIKAIADKDGTTVKINDAKVTAANVGSTNGLIHVLDTVLLPPTDIVDTAVANPNFKTLVAALTAADLTGALKGAGPFTVFAPTDAAFSKLPAGVVDALLKAENKASLVKILSYHVTSQIITSSSIGRLALPVNITMLAGGSARVSKDGTTVKINDASITAVDTFNSNGMIHVIDTVILPPLDIVETAITNGNFKTLLTALAAADLTSTLKGDGPFTVFAPNDAAFAKLSNETLDDLLKPENKARLTTLLKYHVISGKKITSDELEPSKLDMLDGGSVTITKDGDQIKINGNSIIAKNVETSNGIIHVIDGVLTPDEKSVMSRHTGQTALIVFLSMFISVYRFFF